MSSSDSQPPLTRRQARERERASEGGAQPVSPPATVSPASVPVASVPVGSSSGASAPRPSDSADTVAEPPARRRPGSHAAPSRSAPAQAKAQPPVQPAPQGLDEPPASATEIVPGTGMTRRELRLHRAAQSPEASRPVPLQSPTPQSSDRTVADVLGSVAAIEDQRDADAPEPMPDAAAIEQATAADGSPEAIEPFVDAVAHGDEPRRHRSTWSPPPGASGSVRTDSESTGPSESAPSDSRSNVDSAADADADDAVSSDVRDRSDARDDSAQPGTTGVVDGPTGVGPFSETGGIPGLPDLGGARGARTPGVFPLDLDSDTNEVPMVAGDPRASADTARTDPAELSTGTARPASELFTGESAANASAPAGLSGSGAANAPQASYTPAAESAGVGRASSPVEPKPVTTAFDAPAGHWSRQAEVVDDHVHDPETGVVRGTETQANALIMPNSALTDVTGALNATGEVIITGSIDLPKALASTGSHRPIDGVEVDRLLEQHDAEAPSSDATPVRASRAVSSHTSTRAVVLAAAKPKQSKVPTVLAVSAASVGVAGVVAIVVAFFALHLV
ncbi:hypothetical protein [Curtobacterium sp. Leaf261]|uniref:hypothetical protein n=1 Tax=Curtobacterium sp. Leaf261 TaxID=1736311 RepID=UPI0007137CDE|nr:hypothetical protein [Curtobacterium sp. Leaf261]KQO63034.1 hypothetical protein ASF23_09165 [Curtobacterium sp. Leaf261]